MEATFDLMESTLAKLAPPVQAAWRRIAAHAKMESKGGKFSPTEEQAQLIRTTEWARKGLRAVLREASQAERAEAEAEAKTKIAAKAAEPVAPASRKKAKSDGVATSEEG